MLIMYLGFRFYQEALESGFFSIIMCFVRRHQSVGQPPSNDAGYTGTREVVDLPDCFLASVFIARFADKRNH